jgi:hypothetical protein
MLFTRTNLKKLNNSLKQKIKKKLNAEELKT